MRLVVPRLAWFFAATAMAALESTACFPSFVPPVPSDGGSPDAPLDDGGLAATDGDGSTSCDDACTDDDGTDDETSESDGRDEDGAARCDDACVPTATRCGPDAIDGATGVEVCMETGNGCGEFVPGATCGPHQTCVAADGGTSCVCMASSCAQPGDTCTGPGTLTTCATDSDGCVYLAMTTACDCVGDACCTDSCPGCTSNVTWSGDDLSAATVTNSMPLNHPVSPLVSYVDVDSAGQHVDYFDADGHVQETYNNGSGWVRNDLTSWSGGVPAFSGSPVGAYAGTDGSQHINFVAANSLDGGVTSYDLHELYCGEICWADKDLTAMAQSSDGPSVMVPSPQGAITGYWDSLDAQHVFFVGADAHIHEMYDPFSGGQWVDNDLFLLAMAQGPVGSLSPTYPALNAYWGENRSQHVNYVDAGNGHVHELYSPSSGGWVDNDLTELAATNGPSPAASPLGPIRGYWVGVSAQHVVLLDTGGDVHVLVNGRVGGPWFDSDVSATSGARSALPGSDLRAVLDNDGSEYIGYVDDQNGLNVISSHPWSTGWQDAVVARVAPGDAGSPITAYEDHDNIPDAVPTAAGQTGNIHFDVLTQGGGGNDIFEALGSVTAPATCP